MTSRIPLVIGSHGIAQQLQSTDSIPFVSFHNTRTAAIAARIPASVNYLVTGGYTTVGDGGGAQYERVNSITYTTYAFTSADGAFWQYIPDDSGWNAKVAGVVADGTTDDSDNITNALLPFQNSVYVSNGSNITDTLRLPRGNIILTKPVVVIGSGGAALRIIGQSQSAAGGFTAATTSFVWKAGASTYPSMFIIYGVNQSIFEAINFDASTYYNQGALVNVVHVVADNSYVAGLSGSVTAGANRTFTAGGPDLTANLNAGAAIGVGAAGFSPFPTGVFEIVYIKAVTSSTTFVADCVHNHGNGETLGFGPPTNNITFRRCTFSGSVLSPLASDILVGNYISPATVQAAQVILDSCEVTGGRLTDVDVGHTCSVSAASPAIVTETAHGLTLGRPVKFEGPSGTVVPGPVGLYSSPVYFVIPIDVDHYHITLDISELANQKTTSLLTFTNSSGFIQVNWTAHGLTSGSPICFQCSGSAPSNISFAPLLDTSTVPASKNGFVPGGTTYYISSTHNLTDSFRIEASPGGGELTYSGTLYGNTRVIAWWSGVTLVNTSGSPTTVIRVIKQPSGFHAISGGNVKNFLLSNSVFQYFDIAINGEPMSGSCEIYYPTFAASSVADIQANSAVNLNITSAESESSGQRFLMGVGGAFTMNATLTENSYQSGAPFDAYVIIWGGNLILDNNVFYNAAGDGPALGVVPKVQVSGISASVSAATGPCAVSSHGNWWDQSDGTQAIFYDGSNVAFDAAAIASGTWLVEQVGDYGLTGQYPPVIGFLTIGALKSVPILFINLPVSPVDGQRAYITNCSTSTFYAAADGAGALHVPVFYSSAASAWKVG